MRYELYRLVFPNGKLYIGIARETADRWKRHVAAALHQKSRFPVHAAIRKYRPVSIKAEKLVIGEKNFIQELEIKAIACYRASERPFGYNVHFGGTTSPMHNPAVAARVSQAKKGVVFSSQSLANMAEGYRRFLADHGEAHRIKLSNVHRKRWAALSVDKRHEAIQALIASPPWNKGLLGDPKLIEAARKGVANRSTEWLANVTAANRGMSFTPAREAQLAAARRNVDHVARTAKSAVGNRRSWADPAKRAARIEKLRATWAAKRQ